MSDSEAQSRAFRRRGLGRGLDALFKATPEAEGDEPLLVSLDPAGVLPNPEQPRRDFDESGLDALGDSIRIHGLLHPIVVQRDPAGYRLVAGERRLRAAQRAGVTSIPAIVRPAAESGRHALEMALTENLLRTDLNPLEEAAAYARLADAFGLSHEAIGMRVGRSRPAISNAIRLLGLSAPVQEALAERRIGAAHARALLGLPEVDEQEALARRIEAEGWTVQQTERAVQLRADAAQLQKPVRPGALPTPAQLSADDEAIRTGLEAALGLPVRLHRRRRNTGGDVIVSFQDNTDLDALYTRLGGAPL